MLFSSIIQTIKIIQEAQNNGLEQQKYEIPLSDIISDYNAMLKFYQTTYPSASSQTKLSFKKEVSEFYSVVDSMSADNDLPEKENNLLFETRTKVRSFKEKLSLQMASENEN